jgi:hypothetical protein
VIALDDFDVTNEMDRALKNFFGSFENITPRGVVVQPSPIPVYRRGYATVKDAQNRWTTAPFPFIEYEVVEQAFQGQQLMSATIWNRVPGKRGHFDLVHSVMGQFKRRLSPGGLILPVGDSGSIVMAFDRVRRRPPDPHDPNVQEITAGDMQYWVCDYTI